MGLFPKNLNEFVAGMGIPRGPLSKVYLVDPVNGSASNTGTTWQSPLLSIEAAENLCVANRHDVVLFLAGATANVQTAMITWDKNYTHLIGVGSELPGVGQRCRIVAGAALDLDSPLTISASGCIFKNFQVNNEHAAGAATGGTIVTGLRNYFENVFFMNPTSDFAASYALKLSGAENYFKRCSIGQNTNPRNTGASRNLWMNLGSNGNKFVDCEFRSWAGQTAHVLVFLDIDITNVAYNVQFENCLFQNLTIGGAGGTLAVAIDDNCATTDHQVLLRGQGNCFAGCTAVADPLTYVLKAETGTGTQSGLLMATVAE